MKLTSWNILTIILLIGTLALAAVFTVVFAMPNVLPLSMRPVIVPNQITLPTATETPFKFPATWTKSPVPTDFVTETPTNTATLEPSQVTPSQEIPGLTGTIASTSASSQTSTVTPTKTATVKVNVVVSGKTATPNKTPTKTPKATKTKTPTPTLLGGVPYFAAVDDIATVAPYPSSVTINVLGNDYNHTGEQARISKILTYPKHGAMSVDLYEKIIYKPREGFTGVDIIQYKSTTNGGWWDNAWVYIYVMDSSMHPPTDIAPNNINVLENEAAGTVIGPLTATDPDAGDTFKFKLVVGDGDDDNTMVVLSQGGVLKTAAMYNREIKSLLKFRVRVTDSTGLFYEEKLTITVGNVNEAPQIITSSPPDGKVGKTYSFIVRTSDVDATDTRNIVVSSGSLPTGLSLVDNGNGTATISGVPSVAANFIFTILVTDAGGLTDQAAYNVRIDVGATATPSMTPTFTPIPT